MGKLIQETALMLIKRIDLHLTPEELALSPTEVAVIIRERSGNWITAHLKALEPKEMIVIFLGCNPSGLKEVGITPLPFESFARSVDAIRHYIEMMLIEQMRFIFQRLKYAENGPASSYNELIGKYVDAQMRRNL